MVILKAGWEVEAGNVDWLMILEFENLCVIFNDQCLLLWTVLTCLDCQHSSLTCDFLLAIVGD